MIVKQIHQKEKLNGTNRERDGDERASERESKERCKQYSLKCELGAKLHYCLN
jgi:hypothetical protein